MSKHNMWSELFLKSLYFESFFSAAIVFLSSMIYLRTKELYDLSKHKGIKYFRQGFLFFGLTFLIILIIPLFKERGVPIWASNQIMILNSLIVFFETVAILSLLYSMLWKKINYNKISLGIYVFAAIISLLELFKISIIQNFIHPILFLIALLMSLYHYVFTKKKKHFSIHLMYILLFLSLMIHNIGKSLIRIETEIAIILYSLSVMLFGLIFYKVWKSTKNEKKR